MSTTDEAEIKRLGKMYQVMEQYLLMAQLVEDVIELQQEI